MYIHKLQCFTCNSILDHHTDKGILVIEILIQIILKAKEYFSQNS